MWQGLDASVLQDRVSNYRLFSRLFLRPLSEADIDTIAELKLEEVAKDMEGESLLKSGFNDMGRGLHRRHSGTSRVLSTDFTMCFDGVSSYAGLVALPYASIFKGSITGEKAILFQEPRTYALRAYRKEGVEVDESLHLPEDHLSFELSFMADLSEQALLAYKASNFDEAARLLEVSKTFLCDNILNWYDDFKDLSLKILDTRFYRGVVKATAGYLALDLETVADLLCAA